MHAGDIIMHEMQGTVARCCLLLAEGIRQANKMGYPHLAFVHETFKLEGHY